MLRLPYWVNAADLAIYRPLTTVSFAVDWFIGRGLPWVFHAMNVLEHGVASVLVYLLLAELAAPAAAFAGALVFAVHPVHVEAVANVVGRAEVMSAIFYLWALLLWARAPRPGLRQVAAVSGLYLLMPRSDAGASGCRPCDDTPAARSRSCSPAPWPSPAAWCCASACSAA
jgi:hypothetical protein